MGMIRGRSFGRSKRKWRRRRGRRGRRRRRESAAAENLPTGAAEDRDMGAAADLVGRPDLQGGPSGTDALVGDHRRAPLLQD